MNDFPIENLPYGAFVRDGAVHLGVAFGERIFDLHASTRAGAFDGICARGVLEAENLNRLLAQSPRAWSALRARVRSVLSGTVDATHFVDRASAEMRMPFAVADYVDFYSSEQHARNLGRIFRPDAEPLLPNWKWMPIGYHGRAGTIVVSGTTIVRPKGQRKPPEMQTPAFGPSTMLDVELELGFVTGDDAIFGLVLVNDWSARDIQAWEYQPLGPFLGKSFATTISPWVVPLDALAACRIPPPTQDPPPLEHLRVDGDFGLDIELEIELQSEKMRAAGVPPAVISRTNARELYWTMAQQLAHVRSNGSRIRPGDLFASGTISGFGQGASGSLIELTWRGAKPIALPNGEKRGFLEDGDEVTLRGWGACDGVRIGLGCCSGRIVPAT